MDLFLSSAVAECIEIKHICMGLCLLIHAGMLQ